MKKIIAMLLVIAIVATSVYVTYPETKEVQAAETSVVADTIDLEGANLDMIKIKMQALENPYTYNGQDATKLRIVASVDSLDYAAVGFKIWYNEDITNGTNGGLNEKPTVTVKTGTVYERIVAANDGVAYEYSPKVVDTSSEYFVTATLINIVEKNWDKNFYIKAYYITLDGQTVEGEGRFFNINKANSPQNINIPIEMTKDQYDSMTEVKVADTTYQIGVNAEKAYYDGKCGHVYINVVDKTALKSASLIQVGADANAPSTIYRNLNSTYKIDNNNTTGDTSWYDVYLQKYPDQTEFIIANEADLYGLASKYTTNTSGKAKDIFVGQTFYLIKDMEMNDVVGGEFQTKTLWKGIGKFISSNSLNFDGTFDGQGHTISGIYRDESTNGKGYAGFFNRLGTNARVINLRLTNSIIKATTTNGQYVGGLVGYAIGGNLENVSVEATVSATSSNIGGFIGQFSPSQASSFKNCQFKGNVTSGANYAGGIIGHLTGDTAKVTIEDCRVQGTVKASTYLGGFIGEVNQHPMTLDHCLSVASLDGTTKGGVIGRNASNNLIVNNVYTIASDSVGGIETLTEAEATGEEAFVNTLLDFVDHWTVVDNSYPELRLFASEVNPEPTGRNRVIPDGGDTTWASMYLGTSEDPYILKDAADLLGMANWIDTKEDEKKDASETDANKNTTKYFKIANDITVTYNNDDKDTRVSWDPIGEKDSGGAFKHNFDGQGHTISGLYYDNMATNISCVGLFAGVKIGNSDSGVIENFTLENCNITAHHITGSIAGIIYGGTFRNIRVAESVHVEGDYAIGGATGRITPIEKTYFEQCSFEGSVKGTSNDVGGMIGLLQRDSGATSTTHISNCLVKGTVTNTGKNTGGICGQVAANHALTVEYSMVVPTLSGGDSTCGVVGYHPGSGASSKTILGNVYITHKNTLSPGGSQANSVQKITDSNELKGIKGYQNTRLDFKNYWTIVEEDYPQLRIFADVVKAEPTGLNRAIRTDDTGTMTGDTTWLALYAGTEEDPYVLKDADDLYGLAYYTNGKSTENPYAFVGKYFVLVDDIIVNHNNQSNDRNPWISIGGMGIDSGFRGNFDGQGHTISGLYQNGHTRCGLFGRAGVGAKIKNVVLSDCNFSATQQLGTIVGVADGGHYSNIQITDSVELSATSNIGGFVGWLVPLEDIVFDDCQFEGRVEAGSSYAGGAVGTVQASSRDGVNVRNVQFQNCSIDGDVEVQGSYSGGYCGSIKLHSATFLNCKFNGILTSNNEQTGGFIGHMDGITVCMEQCQVDATVTSQSRIAGGFIGWMGGANAGSVSMKYCLNTGAVDVSAYQTTFENDEKKQECNPYVGGFIGLVDTDTAQQTVDIKNCISVADIKLPDIEAEITTYGPILGHSKSTETTVIERTYAASEGKGSHIIGQFEQLSVDDMIGADAQNNMPLLDWNVWEVTDSYPTLKFNASAITTDDVTASEEDLDILVEKYPSANVLYQGEAHAHAETYGRGQDVETVFGTIPYPGDDGETPLATWKTQMDNLKLDFAASYDHNQTNHIAHQDWEISKFLYGTEAGTKINSGIIGSVSNNGTGEMHYNMIFKTQSQLEAVLKTSAFGFAYNDTRKTFDSYPAFANKSAFDALIKSVTDNGGFFVHAHPKTSSFSTNELDYWFGPNTAYTGFEVLYKDTEDESQNKIYTESNYNTWKALLNKGYRLYATAGSDTHGDLNVRALTSVYSDKTATDADKGTLIDQFRVGNFTAGPVGIQMSIGDMVMGGHSAAFTEGQKLVVNIGKFHEKTFNASHKYMVSVYNDQGVVYAQRLTMDEATMTPTNGTFAIPVDVDSQYYRVEVYDMTENTWFAFGNPIWNGEKTYQ